MNDLQTLLEREPVPELSPFFAARVSQKARVTKPRLRQPFILRVYWLAFLTVTVLAFEWITRDAGSFPALVMVPIGFSIYFWRLQVGSSVVRLAAKLFPG